MILVTSSQMQTIDRHTIKKVGIPGRVLMENAGRGATQAFLRRLYTGGGRVGVLAGRGNNGGDGFVMARCLAHKGIDVRVYLLCSADRVEGDAAANLGLLPGASVPVIEIPDKQSLASRRGEMRHMAYWIDAMLGTGLRSEVRGHYRRVIEFINQAQSPVLAVDIPSGLNADTGQPWGVCVRAAATATFGCAKIGHLLQPGAQYCGPIDLIDIGIPPSAIDHAGARQHLISGKQVANILGRRSGEAHKGDQGHVLVVAGSSGKTGAAAMTATSALRAGAGLVTLATPQSLNPVSEVQVTEAMTLPLPDQGTGLALETAFDTLAQAATSKQVLAIGPGLGTADSTRKLVSRLVRRIARPLVIDADGLNNLAGQLDCLEGRKSATILTPHPGEMARLTAISTSRIQQDRVAAARALSMQSKTHVVLKGARTVISAPDGAVWINPTGNPGMASGGMGDVLTGLLAGLLAQGRTALDACLAGVYLHGLAADMLALESPWGYLATEVMQAIPRAIHKVIISPPTPSIQEFWTPIIEP